MSESIVDFDYIYITSLLDLIREKGLAILDKGIGRVSMPIILSVLYIHIKLYRYTYIIIVLSRINGR